MDHDDFPSAEPQLVRGRPVSPAARWRLVVAWCLIVAAGLVGLGCGVGGNGEGPGHRAQKLVLTPQQEYALGEQAYREVLAKSQVVRGGPQVERVRQVGERIAKAAQIEPLQREINLHLQGYRFDWEFNVLRDDHVNAFCLPGGKVAVFTGLLPVAENDDQLATVMSHEIAHALAHHANERLARQQKFERAVEAASGILGQINPQERKQIIGLLAAGAQFGSLPFDRKQEAEADHIGVFLMTFAGYDPRQAVDFWERMKAIGDRRGHVPEILSDHPSDAHRIAAMQKWVPLALAGKQAYDEGRIAPAPRR